MKKKYFQPFRENGHHPIPHQKDSGEDVQASENWLENQELRALCGSPWPFLPAVLKHLLTESGFPKV